MEIFNVQNNYEVFDNENIPHELLIPNINTPAEITTLLFRVHKKGK